MRRSHTWLAFALFCACVSAQGMSMSAEEEEMLEAMGVKGQPMGRKNLKPQAEIFKSDLKYIHCGVCRKMVDIALEKSHELLSKRFKFKAKRKNEATEFDGEHAVQEYLEKMCNPLKPEGDWVSKIDLVQEGDQLQLASQPMHGHCQKECRTVEQACNDIIDKADTEFTEILYQSVKEDTPLDKVQRYICNRAAGVCKKKAPPLTKPRKHDEKFKPMTAEEKQMADMQANLKDSGMSGTMYRREDLAGMMDKLGDMTGGMEGMEGGEEGMEGGEEGDGSEKDEM